MASSTCAPQSRSKPRTTLTKNQANQHLPDKAPDRNESQADSQLSSAGTISTREVTTTLRAACQDNLREEGIRLVC